MNYVCKNWKLDAGQDFRESFEQFHHIPVFLSSSWEVLWWIWWWTMTNDTLQWRGCDSRSHLTLMSRCQAVVTACVCIRVIAQSSLQRNHYKQFDQKLNENTQCLLLPAILPSYKRQKFISSNVDHHIIPSFQLRAHKLSRESDPRGKTDLKPQWSLHQ